MAMTAAMVMAAAMVGAAAAAPLGPTVTLRGGLLMPTISMGNGGGCHPDPDGTEKATCSSYNTTNLAISVGYRGERPSDLSSLLDTALLRCHLLDRRTIRLACAALGGAAAPR